MLTSTITSLTALQSSPHCKAQGTLDIVLNKFEVNLLKTLLQSAVLYARTLHRNKNKYVQESELEYNTNWVKLLLSSSSNIVFGMPVAELP